MDFRPWSFLRRVPMVWQPTSGSCRRRCSQRGYKTAIVGKWHLGHADRKYWPRQRGFDYQYGPLLGEIDYFTHSAHGTRDWFRDNQPVTEEGYVTELLGR